MGSGGKHDEYYTRPYAIQPILPYIPKGKIVWCPFDKAESNYVSIIRENGNTVIHSHIEDGNDFFEYEPEEWDIAISNPPYSRREDVLERLFSFGKPFAMLLNEMSLFGSRKRFKLFKNNQFEKMIFNKRINYDTPNGALDGAPFNSIYVTSGFLPSPYVFYELE